MIVLLSPAKKMGRCPEIVPAESSEPAFKEQAGQLIGKLRTFSRKKIGELMHISPALAEMNYQRYHAWQETVDETVAHPAIYAFRGDVYSGLDADSMSPGDLKFAQGHLRILSGLYGVLQPMDLIQPHRLEMGTRLAVRRRKNLYDFWKDKIAPSIEEDLLTATGEQVIINLASGEYFKSVDRTRLHTRIITCHFREYRDGELKTLMLFVKQARGSMARFIIDKRITESASIKAFDRDGYAYDEGLSSENDWFFVRGR